ncbi:MAG: H-type lectin domain-containing protein [Ignavibacterium sp.]|jgi:hypothetical protein|nr:H-type lectin domain-containing protein [Ignavibacterium sp.]
MKKLLIFVTVLFLNVFTSVIPAQTQSGFWESKIGDTSYNLDVGTGERSITLEVKFSKSYEAKPKVFISVSQLDADKNFNCRYNVEALSVSKDGFTIKIMIWADTKIYSIGGYWLAYIE